MTDVYNDKLKNSHEINAFVTTLSASNYESIIVKLRKIFNALDTYMNCEYCNIFTSSLSVSDSFGTVFWSSKKLDNNDIGNNNYSSYINNLIDDNVSGKITTIESIISPIGKSFTINLNPNGGSPFVEYNGGFKIGPSTLNSMGNFNFKFTTSNECVIKLFMSIDRVIQEYPSSYPIL